MFGLDFSTVRGFGSDRSSALDLRESALVGNVTDQVATASTRTVDSKISCEITSTTFEICLVHERNQLSYSSRDVRDHRVRTGASSSKPTSCGGIVRELDASLFQARDLMNTASVRFGTTSGGPYENEFMPFLQRTDVKTVDRLLQRERHEPPYFYSALLTNLTAGQRYYYVVSCNGTSDERSFRAPPVRSIIYHSYHCLEDHLSTSNTGTKR